MARAHRRATWVALFSLLTLSTVARAEEPRPDSIDFPAPTAAASGVVAPTATGASAPAASGSSAPAASGSGAAPVASVTHDAGLDCDEAVAAWAKGASQRTGLAITPGGCPSGVVRLKVAGAGCDFEVRREGGFQRTPDGSFGVSPIANLDWAVAPEPMKKALAGLLTALAEDRSLPIPTGQVRNHRDGERQSDPVLGSRRNQIAVGAGAMALLGAVAFGLRRRRRGKPPAPPAA